MSSQRLGLVFIHGFLSSASTWSPLLRLIDEDAELSGVVAHPFQYASPAMSLSPARRIPNLNDVADSLRTFLADDLGGYEDLVLISHSMGGLVAQRMLARTLARGRGEELARIRLIVMFACPNSGSDVALLLRRKFWFWRNPQERELRPLNEMITDAQRIVLNQVIHATTVSASTCPIRVAAYAGESDGVVTPASAMSVFPDVGVLPGDHFSIIRPDSNTHRCYVTLKTRLLATVADAEQGPSPVRKQRPALGQAPPQAPAQSPRPGNRQVSPRMRGQQYDQLVNALLAVPRMKETAFREQMYELLPDAITDQLRRDSAARLELFALVTSFDHYRHLAPWQALATALDVLVPDQPAVADVVSVLKEQGLIPG